ncbi:hypothetical protein D910_01844 [Dendroctonus ponderosae]|uniref:Chitin-binding type-2 domain-containing protein n=1 Tax=Dendroctonus ponderosae TaxID=77166 RepID=U4U1E2_DENPD|nr:hypothetical protein D910_01844 [Dendroctonus ponderosae]
MKDSQNWTLERDEDQAGPYIFRFRLSFQVFLDKPERLEERYFVLWKGRLSIHLQSLWTQSKFLHSEYPELLTPKEKFTLYGRQGYFVHPRSCNRFYRCVKFNQLKEEYNVFEFDCPAGLAFDERVEVCVWPGSLPHGTPCSGSSEIAPVPRERFVCPSEPGYYADPENCRWFFACLDHGKSPLQAYEFRCPFGLVFDGDRLVCEWPWLVPKCSNGAASGLDSGFYYGGSQNQGAPGLILQSYDGLGSLGAVKLGGVSGTIERPLTALYTNAASGALGLGYPNHQGYIGGGGGLSYKEAQALQNAGFLRVNNGVGYQASAQSGQAGLSYVSTGSAGGAHQQGGALVGGASLGLGSDYYNSGQYEASSGQAQEEPLEVALRNDGSKGAAVSSQSFTRYHGLTGGSANSAAGSHEYNQGNYATSKPGLQSIDSASYGSNGLDFGAKLVGNGAGGASYSQYHGEKEAKNSLQYGGVNIIGGGYSAVGTLSNVNIYPNGQSHVVTASPEVLPVAKIPTVTAVPVPGIKAISGFDTIRGGVIANIPELQYKVKSFEDAGLFTNGSTNFVNFVVTSAPASQQTYSQTGGYAYNKPAISFEEKPVKTVGVSTEPNLYISSTGAPLGGVAYSTPKPFTVVPTGYSYEKPLVKFEETPQVSSTPAPHSYQAVGISQENEQASVVSKFSFGSAVGQQTGTSAGYYYQQPVAANEIPEVKQEQVVTYYQPQQYFYQQQPVPLTQQPERLSTYTYQPPVQRRPAVTPYTYQNVVQQAVGVVYKQPETSPVLPVQSAAYLPIRGPSYQYIHSYTNEQNANNAQHDRYVYSTPRPLDAGKPAQPAVVTSYFNLQSSKAQAQSNAQQANAGYTYSKPSVTFGEAPASFSTPKPDSADINSYFNVQTSKAQSQSSAQQANVGYEYSKPSVSFVETPVVVSTPEPAPAVVSSYFNLQSSKAQSQSSAQQANVGYVYSKPSVSFVEAPVVVSTPQPAPAVVSSYFNLQSSKAQSQSSAQQANVGYEYSKPSVSFVEAPVVVSTPQPAPAVVSSYFNLQTSKAQSQSSAQQANEGYVYSKPSVSFVEAPVVVSTPKPASAVASSYFNLQTSKAQAHNEQQQANVGYTYAKPSVSFVEAPKPALAVVNSYFNLQSSNAQAERGAQHENVGYTYSKPAIGFEETPVRFSTSKPSPSSYFSFQSSKAQAESSAQQANAGYTYAKPSVSFEEAPRRVEVPTQPAVVSSYFNIAAAQASAGNLQEEVNVEYSHPQRQEPQRPQGEVVGAPYSTPKPFAAVSSYFNLDASNSHAQSEQRQENYGYTYSKPTELQHSPAKPAVVSSYFNLESAHRPKPQTPPVEPYSSSYFHIGNSQEQPAGQGFYQANSVVSSTSRPLLESKPAASYSFTSGSTTAQPILVQEVPSAKPAVVSSYFNQPPSRGYEYSKPAISFNEEPQPVQEEAFVKKTAYVTGHYDDDYRYKNRGKVVVESYKLPQYEAALAPTVYQQQPQVVYNYVPSTPRPTLISTIKSIAKQPVSPALVRFYDNYSSTPATSSVSPEVLSSTSRPISRYSFSSLDEQYQYNNLVKATTSEPLRTYLPVTSTVRIATSSPKVSKVVEEYVAPEARDYLLPQVRTKAPSREYLPVEVTTPSREYLPVRVRTKAPPKYVAVEVAAPSREYLPSRRVKVTSTTSAPEITTLSREYLPVRVRVTSTVKPSRPVTIIKANDAHPLLSAKLGAQCTCVSNTLKLRKKQKIIIVEDEDEDDGYAVDDAGYEAQRVVDITPTPEVYAKKVVRPGAVGENYYTPVTDVFYQKNTSPAPDASDKEIVKAVRTGLKLVKQAAKDGAREGTSEVLSKHLDRYGPGGVRSRSETLQGTIDCQRAGLFRHPTECNKFYACRWDCTKNRFTLHVFNCPVQLTFDNSLGACNWPSQGPACVDNTLITSD